MIGNDVVDIECARLQSNWRRKGFAQKVFNQEEQQLINQHLNPSIMAWRLWSMKESAYKHYLQLNFEQHRFFNPLLLQCNIHSKTSGSVCIYGTHIKTKSIVNEKYIYTQTDGAAEVRGDIFYLKNDPCIHASEQIKTNLLDFISRRNNLNRSKLSIRKSNRGIPSIFYINKKQSMAISLSHHGSYGAYSIIKD